MERSDDAPKYDFVFVDTSYDDDFHLVPIIQIIHTTENLDDVARGHICEGWICLWTSQAYEFNKLCRRPQHLHTS